MILRKIAYTIASIMVTASVAACSSGNVPSSVGINGGADFKGSNLNQVNFNKLVQNLNSQGEKPTIIDMGYKGGVSFAVKINPATTGSSFSTKANAEGHRFVPADVDKIKVFLFADDAFASGGSIAPEGLTVITPLDRVGSAPMNVIFTNVPGNADAWRVAVTSLSTTVPGGSALTPRNITKAAGVFGINGVENYSVSSTGGDGDGSLLIDATDLTFATGSETALGIATTLRDADGAQIDSNTTVSAGSSTPSGAIVVTP